MPLFGKRRAAKEEGSLPSTEADGHRHHKRSPAESYSMSKRPSFGQWVKHTWLDIVTMAIMGALGLGIYFAEPRPARSFAVTFSDGQVVYPQFAYPLRDEVVPIWLAAFLASMVPITIMAIMQIRVRSFWDFNNAVIGILYSLITAALFQVWVKWLIGGLRPHFLDVCDPDPAKMGNNNGEGFQRLYFRPDICRGEKKLINDALESFPSGHTTAAFAGFGYLYLYLNAKLKVFSNYHPSLWKLALTYSPILAAVLIGGALTIDEYHNWYDIFAGAAVGITMAFSSYRMTFAAIWDWRFNHIPLNRTAPFNYDSYMNAELLHAVPTRKAGWGGDGLGHGHGHGHHDKHAAGMGAGHVGHHDGMGHHNGVGHHNGLGHQDGAHSAVGGHANGVPANDGFTQHRRPVGGHGGDHMV
ncbi:hypothetical protein ACKVV7_002180 [Pyricularia oryzae]